MPELMIDFITSLDGYDGYPDVSLDLVGNRTFDGRLELLEYIPTVLAGPPGAGR